MFKLHFLFKFSSKYSVPTSTLFITMNTTATPPEAPKSKKLDVQNAEKIIEDDVELLIARINDSDAQVRSTALAQLRSKLRDGKGSVTSLPKPLKYVRAKVDRLAQTHQVFEKDATDESQPFARELADMISFVMTTFAANDVKVKDIGSALRWKLTGNSRDLAPWGHEFVRHLTADVAETVLASDDADGLHETIIQAILEFEFAHNGEIHAVDFLLEVNQLDRLGPFLTASNFDMIGKYLQAVAAYLPKGEDMKLLEFIGDAYSRFGYHIEAARFWLRIGNIVKVQALLMNSEVPMTVRAQMAHIAAVHGGVLTVDFLEKLEADESADTMKVDGESTETNVILRILRNVDRERHIEHITNRLDLKTPKKPTDILKTSFDASPSLFSFGSNSNQSFEWLKLAKCAVDCVSNAAQGEGASIEESLQEITAPSHRVMAIASQGFLHLWKQEKALNELEVHASSSDENIRAGAAFAMGAVFAGCPCAEFDPVYSLLSENVPGNVLQGDSLTENCKMLRITSIVGLGIAHAGTKDSRITESLVPLLVDFEEDIDVQCFAALAIGLVFLGSMHQDTVEALTIALMEKSDSDLKEHFSIVFMILGLALLFLGHREEADTMIMTTKTFPAAIQEFAENTIISLAYAGTGNVMQLQRFLSHLMQRPAEETTEEDEGTEKAASGNMEVDGEGTAETESSDKILEELSVTELSERAIIDQILSNTGVAPPANDTEPTTKPRKTETKPFSSRAVAVLGIGLIAMSEDIGNDMCKRMMDHILQFGGNEARRGIPLALAFMSISDPSVAVLEALAKLSHDSDEVTAQNAILGIGFVAAGTNNSRAITMLRNLNSYYAKREKFLFFSHYAMGLVSLGKGLMTLSPLHSERFLLSNVSIAGLLTVAISMMDPSKTIFQNYHFILLMLVLSARPRALLTVDATLSPQDITVRVGTAVDTVATVGKHKRMTGFQTHSTPALLSARDNAEVPIGVNDPERNAISPVIEGVVIVEKSEP